MRWFWLCFTSILLPVCLRVYHIGIPALFYFPLEKLAFLDGPGKTTKREALTRFRSSFFLIYFFLLLPLCFLLFVLNSSHCFSFWVLLLLLLFSLHSLSTLLLSSSAFSSSWIDTHIHSCSLNTDSQLLGTSAWMCLCVRVWKSIWSKRHFLWRVCVCTLINLRGKRRGRPL